MSVGLIALLDDVAAIAKVAAASLDDIAAQTAKAGAKAAGVVIDDAAVTPRYVVGFKPDRELPIVWRIAIGSIRNKLLILLPACLLLSAFAPWLIMPLLMLGGAYLCYEGVEKIVEALFHHENRAAEEAPKDQAAATGLEEAKIAGAIKTDFILSAEIMAITLSGIPADDSVWMKAAVLAAVGLAITAAVYGVVALIVKADDVGVAMAKTPDASSLAGLRRAFGRGLVVGMPVFLKALAVVGTAAMVWVGGGIIVHGLEGLLPALAHGIEGVAEAAAHALPFAAGAVRWIVAAAGAGVVGLIVGAALVPLVSYVIAPIARAVTPAKAKPTSSAPTTKSA
ncbi:DUF808 domain-containing protein [Methylopila sp. 73B]|uniref:DUF808 domain-containing protein n=1 Tax=Methylopila sp. 73B TaxID=1120792 RepID=UPI00037F98C8|nr:DUF808 domain-containing protein [Methylopila sp. 73B]